MRADVVVSPRIAPQIIGVGLLEAIDPAHIEGNARAQAASPGPIKGVPNRVWDAPSQRMMLGRFGWKANVATIAHQTAGAFNGDIGITSSMFPDEACTSAEKDCLAAPRGGKADRRSTTRRSATSSSTRPPSHRPRDAHPAVRRCFKARSYFTRRSAPPATGRAI